MTHGWQRTYFEKEIEPEKRAAGDDGEPGGVPAGDGLRHVRGILEQTREAAVSGGPGDGGTAVRASEGRSSFISFPSTSSRPRASSMWQRWSAARGPTLPFCHRGDLGPDRDSPGRMQRTCGLSGEKSDDRSSSGM